MKFTVLTLLATAVMTVSAAPAAGNPYSGAAVKYFSGFNMGANKADGACKTQADWEAEFDVIKSWGAQSSGMTFDHVKLFSTNDCNALVSAVPAALAKGMKIWAGVWNVDDAKFETEKKALEAAIRAHGSSWLAGINVGSESFYRKEITGDKLAQQIWDVKGMVQISLGAPDIAVGTADTWNSWTDGRFAPVISAVDVALMNGFPYWQGVTVDGGLGKFQEAITNTKNVLGGKTLVIGETGWPSNGDPFGSAEATLNNEAAYWKAAACWLKSSGEYPWFWFSAFDEPQKWESVIERNFGFATSDRKLKFDIKC